MNNDKIREVDDLFNEINSLMKIFAPYIIIGKEYMQGSKICNKIHIDKHAPKEVKIAFKKCNLLIDKMKNM